MTGVVNARRHFVGDEFAVLDEELDGENAHVVELFEDALQIRLRLLLQRRVAIRRNRVTQNAIRVCVRRDGIATYFAARAAHTDKRYFAAEIYEGFVDQRHAAECFPRG